MAGVATVTPYHFPVSPQQYGAPSHTAVQGNMPPLKHRRLTGVPAQWQPFTLYYIKGHNDRTARHFITDARGIATPVGDSVFYEWQSRPGNANGTIEQFVTILLGSAALETRVTALEVPRTYQHTQAIPSDTWTIPHNLGVPPSVRVIVGLSEVIASVSHPTINQSVVSFALPWAGSAYCNI